MTGLEKMKSQILEEAEASAKAILADAQKEADVMKQKGKEEAEAVCREISQKSQEEVKAIEERAVSSCDLQRRKALLTAKQEIIAEVPMGEMGTYAIDLRSMTQGRGMFTYTFLRYEDAPPAVQEKAIAEAKLLQGEEN